MLLAQHIGTTSHCTDLGAERTPETIIEALTSNRPTLCQSLKQLNYSASPLDCYHNVFTSSLFHSHSSTFPGQILIF